MASDSVIKNYATNNKEDALYQAQLLKCTGFYSLGDSYYPCSSEEELRKSISSRRYDILIPSTFETVDTALYEWINNDINIFSTTNEGWKKVPVIWITERSFQIKSNKDLRSKDSEALIFPLISVERTAVKKTESNKRPIPAQIYSEKDGTSLVVAKKLKQTKTKNFASAASLRFYKQKNFKFKNKKVVYEFLTIPLPIYHDVRYTIRLRAEYQEQMNEMLSPLLTFTNNINQFMINSDGHRYEAFIDTSYAINNNISNMANNERIYESTVTINVLGYLIGANKNQSGPKIGRYENRVDVRFPREHVMVGDLNEIGKTGFRS